MAEIKLASIGGIKVGNYVLMGGKACVVKSVQISKTGKHGHAKCRVEAVSMTDGQKFIEVHPTHDNIQVPIIDKRLAQVLSVQQDTVNVMDTETYETFDLKLDEEFKGKVKEGDQVVYWIILDEKVLKQIK